jgi:uncharacterized protein
MKPKPQVHRFSLGDMKLALDVNSGALHQVDDVTWAILENYPEETKQQLLTRLSGQFTPVEIESAWEDLVGLQQAGLLFSEAPALPANLWPPKLQVKALCLHVAHDCNLRCPYCFGDTGEYCGERGLMTKEVGRAAIDFMLANCAPRNLCEIDFFGGEPLLNFELIKELVAYAREEGAKYGKELMFTVTTNGVLLNEDVCSYLNANRIKVVLSIDGRKEVHDRMRFFPGGKGSYNHILPRLQAMAAARSEEDCVIRGTFTRHNTDFLADILHLVDQGFTYLSLEPVVAKEASYGLRESDLPVIFNEYERLAQTYIQRHREGNPFRFFHFDVYLNQGPCLAKRIAGCGAGHEYFAVTPTGGIYPCHQFVGRKEFLLGDVWQGIRRTDICTDFQAAHVYNKEECCSCWARFFCSGGCNANNQLFTGDVCVPYKLGCELSKKRIECALAVQAALSLPSGG